MSVELNTDNDFVINAGVLRGDDPYYRQKYIDLIKGGSVSGAIAPYENYVFSGWNNDAIYKYIASISGFRGVDRFFFLLGGGCAQLGLFADDSHPGGASGLTPYASPLSGADNNNLEIIENGLHVFDMGVADVDCQDYSDFYEYMGIVKVAIDKQKNNIENKPSEDAADGYGVFDQYIAMVTYWNYLVLLLAARSVVTMDGAGVYTLNFFYHNSGSPTPDSTLTLAVEETLLSLAVPITSIEYIFRPAEHESEVTETTTVDGFIATLDTDFLTNTQWIIKVVLDTTAIAIGTEITYVGEWTNTGYETDTSGTFTVEAP
jgi:hypothetical protein